MDVLECGAGCDRSGLLVFSVLCLVSCGSEPKLSPHCEPCIGDSSQGNSAGTRVQPPGEQTWTDIASCCIPSGTYGCCSPLRAVHCKSFSILAGMLKLGFNHPLCSLRLQQPEQGSHLGGQCGIPAALGPVVLPIVQEGMSTFTGKRNYLLP